MVEVENEDFFLSSSRMNMVNQSVKRFRLYQSLKVGNAVRDILFSSFFGVRQMSGVFASSYKRQKMRGCSSDEKDILEQ